MITTRTICRSLENYRLTTALLRGSSSSVCKNTMVCMYPKRLAIMSRFTINVLLGVGLGSGSGLEFKGSWYAYILGYTQKHVNVQC